MAHRALRRATMLAAVLLTATAFAAPAHAADDTGTIAGRLTSSTGAAVANAGVEVYNEETNYNGYTSTGDDGSYTLANLAPGDYSVAFNAEGHPRQYFDNKFDLWEADLVTVAAGGTTTVDEDLAATGTLTGRLLRADGSPLAFEPVVAEAEDGTESNALTDGDGAFSLAVLPGNHRVGFSPIEGSEQRQWVPGSIDRAGARLFTVVGDQTVEVTDTALATGSVTGRVTTPAGEPATNMRVALDTATGDYTWLSARTGANGQYTIAPALIGSYVVSFTDNEFSATQYHRRTLRADQADPVAVTAGAATRVNERLLDTGGLRVTAVDAVTGAPVLRFCVDRCTTTGTIELTGLTADSHEFAANTPGGTHFSRAFTATVREGRTTEVTLRLKPAAQITTTVVDAATSRPLANVCVIAYKAKQVRLWDGFNVCSNSQGKITIGELTNGNYRLFAAPQSTTYGRQWVGATGGTGDERQAAVVPATLGAVATAPQIRIDPAGAIAGTVTDAETGAPIEGARVALFTQSPGLGASEVETDAQGHYQVDGLGPYPWPLKFSSFGSALAWTGGAASRYTATPTVVTAGSTATADIALRDGVLVTGTIRLSDGGAVDGGFVDVRTADSGDFAGSNWPENGQFSIRVLPGQRIYFSYSVYAGDREYRVERVPGDPVRVPAGGLTTEIVVLTA
ncbi:carboxypeptidase-like regulatory domain-containing protein [Asanoa siamensis]|uniref:Alpha-amylase n=1 Tax=Asanoa siamensis TaxID=926357 RepID=A0ABQ4CIC4_9ACTN|nr:carboxypeptidase-like regulatory domain-containing protein [Asanoa siamensis]GIF71057.1 hypothetical protein Asi02nite_05750 [Asanoa siamensis]